MSALVERDSFIDRPHRLTHDCMIIPSAWLWLLVPVWARMKSSRRSARAEWARSTARAIRRLQRDVAIKVLPDVVRERSRAARAVRARGAGGRRAVASQHPRDFRLRRRRGNTAYAVTELLEGETLAGALAVGTAAAAQGHRLRASRSREGSLPRTTRASSIAISSPRTCS